MNTGFDIRPLPWDTDFFGFGVARLIPRGSSALTDAIEELRAQRIRLAYLETDPNDADANVAAIAAGGRLVDRRIGLAADPTAADPAALAMVEEVAREPSAADRTALFRLALASGKLSRFRVDPGFAPGRFEALYQAWIDNSIAGRYADAVLAVRADTRIAGMITVSAKDEIGTIGLFAVDGDFRGRGLGGKLLRGALAWFAARGCGQARVATQGANAAALAAYQATGFTVYRAANTYHFWI